MANDNQTLPHSCFLEWMTLQEQDLAELLQALTLTENGANTLTELSQKNITHYQEYIHKRTQLARNNVSPLFAPAWNSSLENSLLWIAGCRPTMFIRLLYALCGSEVDTHLEEYLRGDRTTGSLGDLSGEQINLVNDLQRKTIKEEEKLTTRLASLQEEIADEPMSLISRGQGQAGQVDEDVDRALECHDKAMASVLEEADKLRLSTLKELIGILTPLQAVDYLAAGKKLHLCVHEWGKRRDRVHGGSN